MTPTMPANPPVAIRIEASPAEVLKHRASKQIAERLYHMGVTPEEAKACCAAMGWAHGSNKPLTHLAYQIIKSWARTSGDANPGAIALQIAADEAFGLHRWLGKPAHVDPATWATARKMLGMAGKTLHTLLYAVYENTQDSFKDIGADALVLVRGQNDILAMDLAHKLSAKHRDEDRTGLPSRAPVALTMAVPPGAICTNPISSWGTDPDAELRKVQAKPYPMGTDRVNGVIQCRFPVDWIFSHPGSGMGCLEQGEVLVLGMPGAYVITAGDTPGSIRKGVYDVANRGFAAKKPAQVQESLIQRLVGAVSLSDPDGG